MDIANLGEIAASIELQKITLKKKQ